MLTNLSVKNLNEFVGGIDNFSELTDAEKIEAVAFGMVYACEQEYFNSTDVESVLQEDLSIQVDQDPLGHFTDYVDGGSGEVRFVKHLTGFKFDKIYFKDLQSKLIKNEINDLAKVETEEPNFGIQQILTPDPTEIYYYVSENTPFDKMPDFDKKRKHTVPKAISSSANEWAYKLMSAEIEEEIKETYNNCKVYLKLKRKEINKTESSIDTPFFKYQINVSQDEVSPEEIKVERRLQLLDEPLAMPEKLDDIFAHDFDQITMPYNSPHNFDDLVDKLEDYTELENGTLLEDDTTGLITIELPSKIYISIDTNKKEVSFKSGARGGPLNLHSNILKTMGKMKVTKFSKEKI